MKKTTLQDMRDILVDSKEGSDRHFWGVVTRQNRNASGDVTSYEVALGGDEGTMTCRKLAGADVGDTVMVTLTKTGMAVVTGTVDGDKDAEAAMTTAEAAQGAVDTLSETVDTLADDVDSIEGLVGDGDETGITITTQYYLSTSNTTQTGGTWSDTLPTYVEGRYYWTKTITTYADGSEVESTPVLDVAAQISAETAAVATATDQHFWSDSTGAYITNSNKNLNSGYAMKATNAGLLQTYNGKNLMALTGSGLSLYGIVNNASQLMAAYTSSGANLYAGGSVAASFTSSGTTIYSGSDIVASFGSDVTVGKTGGYHIKIDGSNGLYIRDSSSRSVFRMFGYGGAARMSFTNIKMFASGASEDSPTIDISSSGMYVLGAINSTGNINAGGSLSGSSLSITSGGTIKGGATINGGATITGGMSASGDVTVGKLYVSTPGTASSSTANCRIATGENNRIMFTGSSSRRVKHDIKPIGEKCLDPHKLYDADVIQFIYNLDYLNDKDERYNVPVIGFIAEDLQKVYPIAVDTENGKAVDWNYRYIIPPMLALIQEQKKEIDSIRKELADIKKLIA